MPKKTTVLILILTVITAMLVYLALKAEEKPLPIPQTGVPTQAPTRVVEKTSILSFSPTELQASAGVNTADIVINTNGKPVTGVQVELVYDPQVIKNVTVIPAQDETSFFGGPANSAVLFKDVREDLGRASFALALNQSVAAKAGTGIVGRITFTVASTNSAFTAIRFLDKSLVSEEGESQSVLKDTTPLIVHFSNSAASSTNAVQQ